MKIAYKNPRPQLRNHSEAGFTIVELMIATLVFTVILVVVTAGVLSFTKEYYKGLNSSATQRTARDIMTAIAQGIQYAGASNQVLDNRNDPANDATGAICVGNVHYYYYIGRVYDGSTGNFGVFRTTDPTYPCTPMPSTTYPSFPTGFTGTELLGPHMRLTDINAGPDNSVYDISVGVAYADDDSSGKADLLCIPNLGSPGGCNPSDGPMTPVILGDQNTDGGQVLCKIQTGSQFCAVSHLSTSVQTRLIANSGP
jgi:type II secretory pathway pseudopilin PulG